MASRATVDLQHTYVTILAGGSGTRLWPHSRVQRPKHLLELVGDSSTLQQTVERVLPLIPAYIGYLSGTTVADRGVQGAPGADAIGTTTGATTTQAGA